MSAGVACDGAAFARTVHCSVRRRRRCKTIMLLGIKRGQNMGRRYHVRLMLVVVAVFLVFAVWLRYCFSLALLFHQAADNLEFLQ